MTAEGVSPAPKMPRADIVLINPGKGLPTPAVFKEYREGGFPFTPLRRLEKTPESLEELVADLKTRGCDLYAPACRLMPGVAEIITVLEASGECMLARMSGSGATCFGIFPDTTAAKSAAAQIRAVRPRWWVETGVINEQGGL
jgi:4-diphosphocytidyl-2-C-methyl-D-erythritol kinase